MWQCYKTESVKETPLLMLCILCDWMENNWIYNHYIKTLIYHAKNHLPIVSVQTVNGQHRINTMTT